MEEIAQSINKLDKETQDKSLTIINNNAKNDEKKKANKLANLVKNLENMKSYFGKMITRQLNKEQKEKKMKMILKKRVNQINILNEKPLGWEFYEFEISNLTNSFWDDLNNSKKENINNVNDISNNFANIIKELKPEDQEKALKLLKDKAINKNNNIEEINNLENEVNNLNKMKEEL